MAYRLQLLRRIEVANVLQLRISVATLVKKVSGFPQAEGVHLIQILLPRVGCDNKLFPKIGT
jgi:hypothetical protein